MNAEVFYFNDVLRIALAAAGLTRTAFARYANVTGSAVTSWTRSTRPHPHNDRALRALGLPQQLIDEGSVPTDEMPYILLAAIQFGEQLRDGGQP